MVFRDSTYSIMIVSSSKNFNDKIADMLPTSDFHPIRYVQTAAEARRLMVEQHFNMVVINAPLKDEHGTKLAMQFADDYDAGVMLMISNEQYDEIYSKVLEHGVMVVGKPTSLTFMSQSLHMLCSSCERMKRLEKKKASVEDKIQEIRLANKAKWLLIEHEKMTEAEAHRYLEKQAMNLRVSKNELAQSIIKKYA